MYGMTSIQLTLFPEEKKFSITKYLSSQVWDDYVAFALRACSSFASTTAIVIATTVKAGQSDRVRTNTTWVSTRRPGHRLRDGRVIISRGINIQTMRSNYDTVKDEPVLEIVGEDF